MNRFLQLASVAFISVVAILMMYLLSAKKATKNNFIRHIRNKAVMARTIQLPDDKYYFAGWSKQCCYLASTYRAYDVIAITDTIKKNIRIIDLPGSQIRASKIAIDSPYFYVANLESREILKGDLKDWYIQTPIHRQSEFTEFLPITASSIILRTFKDGKAESTLTKESVVSVYQATGNELLQKQIDGVFCTDGMLQFDKHNRIVVYTYFYRNQFVCADTSLNLLYRGKTLDTVSRAHIKVAGFNSPDSFSALASPPATVNRITSIADGKLYVNSNLIADNEDSDRFRSNDVIDIYDVTTGHYDYSFYIPKVSGQRFSYFGVHQNTVYALHGSVLNVYRLTSPD